MAAEVGALTAQVTTSAPHKGRGICVPATRGGFKPVDDVTIGGRHAGGQIGWTHLGLGAADATEVRTLWPDGEVGPWLQVSANQCGDMDRSVNQARPWRPPRS